MTRPGELGSSSQDPRDTRHEQSPSGGRNASRGVFSSFETWQRVMAGKDRGSIPPSLSTSIPKEFEEPNRPDLPERVKPTPQKIIPENIRNQILQNSPVQEDTLATSSTPLTSHADIPSNPSPSGEHDASPRSKGKEPLKQSQLRRSTAPPHPLKIPSGRGPEQNPLSPGTEESKRRSAVPIPSPGGPQRKTPTSPLSPFKQASSRPSGANIPSSPSGRGQSQQFRRRSQEESIRYERPFGRGPFREFSHTRSESVGSQRSTRSSYERNQQSLDEMLDAATREKLRNLDKKEVETLYSSEASEIIGYIQEHKEKDAKLSDDIYEAQKSLSKALQWNWQHFWSERISSLQKMRNEVMKELKEKAGELQKKMEEEFNERMKIIQESGLVKEQEEHKKREDGVVLKFSAHPDAIFQQAVHDWVTRKQENLGDVRSTALEVRLDIKYQSMPDDTYGRAQEYAKWHLALIKYLDSGEYTKYRNTDPNTGRLIIDPSTRRPIIKEYTGEEAIKARELVWQALEKNAKALRDLLPRKAMAE